MSCGYHSSATTQVVISDAFHKSSLSVGDRHLYQKEVGTVVEAGDFIT